MKSKKVIMFGGISPEHDISIITACLVQGNGYEKIYVDKTGVWHLIKGATQPQDYIDGAPKGCICTLLPGDSTLYKRGKRRLIPLFTVQYALLCFHGGAGENGTIQGLLETCNLPYSGSAPTASAVCFDKGYCKLMLRSIKAPTLFGFVLKKEDYLKSKDASSVNHATISAQDDEEKPCASNEKTIQTECAVDLSKIRYPVVVKPCCGGSSIGISFADNVTQLRSALELAFCYDKRVIIEKKLPNATDLNVAVLKTPSGYLLSEIEAVQTNGFYSFDNKYVLQGKSQNVVYAVDENSDKIKATVLKVAQKLDLCGVSRVDILSDCEKFYINEINTIPGSLAYHLFAGKLSREEFFTLLEQDAVHKHESAQDLCKVFPSTVLNAKFSSKK